ncbi:ABC transporter permease [Halocatena pleomorpha]|uniref:ABC transporter permease n=1 Tax=Halocatena pleomorpha TaxID=1785090 RepID=A0A3P3R740_9EURY|nr:ABC transporter permease subunit [Halocatena pleomorpha]RRJ29175.1 ABC transporter permease [Halocatena pleomorpha]
MFEIARHQLRHRRLEIIALTAGFVGIALAAIGIVFGTSSQTIGAFLASEVYQFGWVLGLGSYFAYSAGSLLAADIEHNRMDVLLSAPVSRSSIVRQRFLALLAVMLVVNGSVCIFVYLGTVAIGTPVRPTNLFLVHMLSIPYLLVCASIGLLFSVGASTGTRASGISVAVVLALFVLTRRVAGTPYEWLSVLTPAHYYDPTAILVTNAYPVTNGVLLLGVALLLSSLGRLWFRSMDLR